MDARLIEEIDMMDRQLDEAGLIIDMSRRDAYVDDWHVHLESGGCFAGTSKETHAYLSGALAVYNRMTYLAESKAREQGK